MISVREMNKDEIVKNREDIRKVLDKLDELGVLNKISDKNLTAMIYFLYPEVAENSTDKEEIDKIIESLKEKAKQYFRVKREGNDVTIEIL